jgi:hypothetical protein
VRPLDPAGPATDGAGRLARSLAGYLCGTHSGLLDRRRGDRLDRLALASAHGDLEVGGVGVETRLGGVRWDADADAIPLRDGLDRALRHEGVIELVLFGSQARGTATGFSDIDAVLVIGDAAAEDPAALRSLRRSVLEAQRRVIAYQPMQHHGFEVVTPKLLRSAHAALEPPREAFAETRSLRGSQVDAWFGDVPAAPAAARRLRAMVGTLAAVDRWPSHPWRLHAVLSMFELLPALYLQSRGRATPKWESFAEGRAELGERFWPYEVLREVRAGWPRRGRAGLELASVAARNPWVAVAAWTRARLKAPDEARALLSPECLDALQQVAGAMAGRAR